MASNSLSGGIAKRINKELSETYAKERKTILETSYQLQTEPQIECEEAPEEAATYVQLQTDPELSPAKENGEREVQMDTSYAEILSDQSVDVFSSEHVAATADEVSDLADIYRVSFSEKLAQEPNSFKEETDPSWLEEHLQEIKESLEEELINIQGDINSTFEFQNDEEQDMFEENLLAKEIEEIRLSGEKEEKRKKPESESIFPGSRITIGVSALLIMAVVLRHSLSGEALNDILTLISLHCMNNSLSSINKLKKYFCHFSSPLKFHWYCSSCFMLLNDKSNRYCPNSFCSKDLSVTGNSSFFIEVPIADQIRRMFDKTGFYQDLQYRFSRAKKENVISDIYDGEIYKEISRDQSNPLSDSRNISFTWNTDGVPVFKSSNFALWPLYLVINELSPKKRFSKDNMILAGLWFGPSKPAMWSYLKPFHSSLKELEENGVIVKCPGSDNNFRVRAFLICGTCDLPAKACVCNAMQYNGLFGCSKCLQPGCTVKTGKKGGHVHAFPFQQDDVKGPARTHCQMLSDAKEAVIQGNHVRGVKGPCWFAGLKFYDMVKGTAIDYMHCVLEGVTKSLINLWFNPNFKQESFSISDKVKQVDNRLSQIKPPNDITRCPRTIEHERKYWKASELRSFLLFYGPAVLLNILPDDYYTHFIFLSEAIFILLGENISYDQINHADQLLKHFCFLFSALYSQSKETINIHSLLHLADDVRNLGPLWTHSCFPFENYNGILLKFFHGTQNVDLQIVSAVAINQSLPTLASQLTPQSKEEEFYKSLTISSHVAKENMIEKDIFALGSPLNMNLDHEQINALGAYLGFAPISPTIKHFKRTKLRGSIYHSVSYKRVISRNSYTILYEESVPGSLNIGQIEFFFQYQFPCSRTLSCLEKCVCPRLNLAMIRILEELKNFEFVQDPTTYATALQMSAVKSTGRLQVIPISSIQEKLVFMTFQDESIAYAARFPNKVESD